MIKNYYSNKIIFLLFIFAADLTAQYKSTDTLVITQRSFTFVLPTDSLYNQELLKGNFRLDSLLRQKQSIFDNIKPFLNKSKISVRKTSAEVVGFYNENIFIEIPSDSLPKTGCYILFNGKNKPKIINQPDKSLIFRSVKEFFLSD